MKDNNKERWAKKWGMDYGDYEIDAKAEAQVWHYIIWVAVFAYSVLGGHSCGT